MSVLIDKNYLSSNKIRNNTTTRNEVFASEVVSKYILSNEVVKVGKTASKSLPDIFTENENYGFEVRLCESSIDLKHIDAIKELVEDNWNYSKYLKRLNNPNSAISKANLTITHDGNKVTSSTSGNLGHSIDWMYSEYKNALEDKLKKLNNGHYNDCISNCLVILNLQRANGQQEAELFYKAYKELKNNYIEHFENIYFITTNGIYKCNDTDMLAFVIFKDEDFNDLVREMKQALVIDQYEKE